MRVLKGPDPKGYIVALKFINPQGALNFVKEFHMRKFNELEDEACHLSQLQSVHIEELTKTIASPEALFLDNKN
jgi:hypothetical protein